MLKYKREDDLKPTTTIKQNGTMVTVCQHCAKCGENSYVLQSQAFVLGIYPAGIILLSFAILMSGVLITKTLLLFNHMCVCSMDILYSSKEVNLSCGDMLLGNIQKQTGLQVRGNE